jgi:hypothetical protein
LPDLEELFKGRQNLEILLKSRKWVRVRVRIRAAKRLNRHTPIDSQ